MKIPYGKQTIDESDVESVLEVLKSDFLTNGPKIQEFEEVFSNYVGSKYAVVVSSGTAALHLACLGAGLKEDNELITSPLTFMASSNCALYCKAKPVFIDINRQGLIDSKKIGEKINAKTNIIIPVHYSGLPCDMERIKEIAKKHKLIVIEDASHALGAKYKDSKIGDCKYSDMTIFSFHPVKHITTGEGGMITTNSKKTYEKLKELREHGIVRDSSKFSRREEGLWYHEMQDLGYNYKITDIQCALGISQLRKLDKFIERRRKIAKRYDEAFENDKNIEILKENEDQFNSYHLYPILLKDKATRKQLFNYLRNKDIFCQVHYIPIYWQPYYQKLDLKDSMLPNVEDFYGRVISLPIFPDLTRKEQVYVIDKIKSFFGIN